MPVPSHSLAFSEENIRVCVVLKVGGSLFDLPGLSNRLSQLVANQFSSQQVLVVTGGGRLVDAIRQYDAIHPLDEASSHWLSVDLMHTTAALLQSMMPSWPLIETFSELQRFLGTEQISCYQSDASDGAIPLNQTHSRVAIVSPRAYYAKPSDQLPIGWNTTSDTISRLLACQVAAEELVLLKSTDPQHAIEPLLDANFDYLPLTKTKIRLLNLRSDRFA